MNAAFTTPPSRLSVLPRVAPLLLLGALASACATQHVGTRPAPPVAAPTIPFSTDVPSGRGRLVIETTAPARVTEVNDRGTASGPGGTATYASVRDVCTTPCVIDLELGPHELVFTDLHTPTRTSVALVNVTPGVTGYRYEVGTRTSQTGKKWGAGAAIVGAAGGLGWGGLFLGDGIVNEHGEEVAVGLGLLAATAGLTALSYILLDDAGDLVEDGAAAEWRADASGAAPAPVTPPSSPPGLDLEIIESDGVRIARVGPSLAPLEKGDVLVSIDGVPVPTELAFTGLVKRVRPGDRLEVVVRRHGKETALTVEVKAR